MHDFQIKNTIEILDNITIKKYHQIILETITSFVPSNKNLFLPMTISKSALQMTISNLKLKSALLFVQYLYILFLKNLLLEL